LLLTGSLAFGDGFAGVEPDIASLMVVLDVPANPVKAGIDHLLLGRFL